MTCYDYNGRTWEFFLQVRNIFKPITVRKPKVQEHTMKVKTLYLFPHGLYTVRSGYTVAFLFKDTP